MSAWIEASSAATDLVADDQRGPRCERAGDVHALSSAPRRVRADSVRPWRAQPDAIEQSQHRRSVGGQSPSAASSIGSRMLAPTDMRGSRAALESWNTILELPPVPYSARGGANKGIHAAMEHSPGCRAGKADQARAQVDFPEPDSPITPKVSPAYTAKLTPSTALKYSRRRPVGKCTRRSCTDRIGSASVGGCSRHCPQSWSSAWRPHRTGPTDGCSCCGSAQAGTRMCAAGGEAAAGRHCFGDGTGPGMTAAGSWALCGACFPAGRACRGVAGGQQDHAPARPPRPGRHTS